MRICGIDLETNGLSIETDVVTELAWVIKDHGAAKSLVQKSYYVYDGSVSIPPEVTALTKITPELLTHHGRPLNDVVGELQTDLTVCGVDYLCAHNGTFFDKPFLLKKIESFRDKLPEIVAAKWLDTVEDIEWPDEIGTRKLSYLAAEHGFLNPFPHAALFDVMTMLKLLDNYDINTVIKRSVEPWVVLKAEVNYDMREQAKKRRFLWERCGEKTYPKSWVKRVKVSDVEKEKFTAPFQITVLRE